jgi:hypothetical protein
VPTFTCGLVRWNFSLDMVLSRFYLCSVEYQFFLMTASAIDDGASA